MLESETATTEARSVVSAYYENLGKEDYHGAYRQLSVREMERYGTFAAMATSGSEGATS